MRRPLILLRVAAAAVIAVAVWSCGLTAAAADRVGGPFAMTDHEGRRVTDRDFHGRFLMLYFGYTYCPDVCPTGLADMAAAIDLLKEDGKTVQPVFVTIDPDRDTPEVLRDYIRLFHERLIALRGSPEETEAMARAYHVFFTPYVDQSLGDYQYDHTAYIYLVGPDGKYLTYFPYAHPADLMAEETGRFIAASRGEAKVR